MFSQVKAKEKITEKSILYACDVYVPKFFGEMLKMNPKSICMMWPSE